MKCDYSGTLSANPGPRNRPGTKSLVVHAIQMQLLDLAKTKTETHAARHLDLAASQLSINRLAKTK